MATNNNNQSTPTSVISNEEIIKGVNLLWNNKFDEADQVFTSKRDINPRYAVHYAEVQFLRSFITADVNDTHLAMERLKAAKELAESQLRSYEKGVDPNNEHKPESSEFANKFLDCRIVYGDSLYMIAILQMTRDAKIKGAFNLRKSWKSFERALKDSKNVKQLDPEVAKCLHFGAGFFLFAMSIIPQKFLKLVEFVGFRADRDAGLHYIRECHNNGGIRAPFATMVLLFNNLLLPRGLANAEKYLIEADELIKESVAKYPSGSLFHVMGSHCARKQCNVELGIKMMETALENSKNFPQPPLIYRYELANCYCMKMDWKRAVELFEPLIKEEKFQVRALCALQLGAAMTMCGSREKALELYSKIPSFAGKASLDNIVARQAKRYVANGGYFSAFELLYLRRDLAKMLPIMSQVLQALDNVASQTRAMEKRELEPKPETKTGLTGSMNKLGSAIGMGKLGNNLKLNKLGNPFNKKKDAPVDYSYDDRASYLLIRGALLKALGRLDESIACFREVVDMQDYLVEKLYAPYCLYELGEAYYMKNQVQEAVDAIRKCSKISGYDWEDPLRVRLRVTMDQLKKGQLPADQQQKPVTLDSLIASTSSNNSNNTNSGTDSLDDDDKDVPSDDELAVQEVSLNDDDDNNN